MVHETGLIPGIPNFAMLSHPQLVYYFSVTDFCSCFVGQTPRVKLYPLNKSESCLILVLLEMENSQEKHES